MNKKKGQKMKQAREEKGLTQAQIAEKLGINVNYYARIERGEKIPSFEVLQSIAKILKLKSSDILPF